MGKPVSNRALMDVVKTEMNRKARLAFLAARKSGKSISDALLAAKATLPR